MFKPTNFIKFLRLSSSEQSLFFRATVLLAIVGLGLRSLSFRRIEGLLGSTDVAVGKALSPVDAATQARSTARIVAFASRYGPYRANCLPTSLVLRRYLLRQGIQANLRVGVRKAIDGSLEAHAWVEHAGEPLINRADVHHYFAPFDQSIHSSKEGSG